MNLTYGYWICGLMELLSFRSELKVGEAFCVDGKWYEVVLIDEEGCVEVLPFGG